MPAVQLPSEHLTVQDFFSISFGFGAFGLDGSVWN